MPAYTRLTLEPGVIKDETPLASRPRWTDMDKARFFRRRPQPIGGYEYFSADSFSGACRGVFAWAATDGRAFGAIGTHSKLYALFGGRVYNITPIRSTATLGSDPITTANGDETVTIAHSSHGATSNATVYISGAAAVGGITIGGGTGTMSGNAFVTKEGSKFVTVTHASHGLASGDIRALASATAVGGITLDGDYTIYRLDADTFQIEHSSAATSSATGGGTPTYEDFKAYTLTRTSANAYTIEHSSAATSAATGGGAAVKVKYEINIGNQFSTGSGGYGVGGYGSGGYGGGSTDTNTYPRTWSLVQWGQYLNANPRGGTIYEWQLNTSQRAAAVSNAPSAVTSIYVTPQRHLGATGAHDGSAFQPMLDRWSGQEDNTVWTAAATNQAGDFPLSGGSRLLRSLAGPNQILKWSDRAMFRQTHVGDSGLVFAFDKIGDVGLIGPNAAAVHEGMAFWVSPDRNFYVWRGGAPELIDCPVRNHLFDNLSPAQEESIYVWANAEFTEFWVLYPTGTGLECNKYIGWNWSEPGWIVGSFDRTAGIGRSVLGEPIMAGSDGRLYFHEVQGAGANGASLDFYWESSPFEAGVAGGTTMDIFQIEPDFEDLTVGVNISLKTRDHPQGTETTNGPYAVLPSTTDIDVRVSGKLVTYRVAGMADANAFARQGDIRLDIRSAGNR